MSPARRLTLPVLVLLIGAMHVAPVHGQRPETNYDEAKVPKYELPDPLVTLDGQKVTTAEQWNQQRRPEVLSLFANQMYGKAPPPPKQLTLDTQIERNALEGIATRKQVTVSLSGTKDGPSMDILVYLPNETRKPFPLFVGLNFYGNHTIHSDPDIKLSTRWMRNNSSKGVVNNRATEKSRGTGSSRWPVERILKAGFGLATIYYGDIDPDYHDEFQNGIHPTYYKPGQSKPADHEWGSISAWAWGLGRAMDYFETDDDIDHGKVAVMGHSRLGKTSLWAGAQDTRFAIVISNDSGCGGAALSRRRFGETVRRINTSFPHWFNGNFKKYNDSEDQLPLDQHMLIALMAPRPVLVCSAEEDRWADPRGEYLSARGADSVYRLLGTDGISTQTMPAVNEPVMSTIGYHIRPGKHDVTDRDWTIYLDFARKHLAK